MSLPSQLGGNKYDHYKDGTGYNPDPCPGGASGYHYRTGTGCRTQAEPGGDQGADSGSGAAELSLLCGAACASLGPEADEPAGQHGGASCVPDHYGNF